MKKYPSKVGVICLITMAIILPMTVFCLFHSETKLVGWVVLLPILFICIHMFATTYYVIEDGRLIVKSGFWVNKSIEISTIRKIEETGSWMSGPALSMDRLEIFYGKYDSVLISPKQKKEFIQDISTLNPDIEIHFKKK